MTEDLKKIETLQDCPPGYVNESDNIRPASAPSEAKEKNTPIIEPQMGEEMPEVVGQTPEQPNQNLMLIEEIEGLLSQVNDKLGALRIKAFNISTEGQLKDNKHHLVSQALEEIDLLQNTTMHDLRKAFE